jgi:hypothetical protein
LLFEAALADGDVKGRLHEKGKHVMKKRTSAHRRDVMIW